MADRKNDGSKNEKTARREQPELTEEQIAELEAHDVPPSEQHQAQTLRERPAALPDNPLFAKEGVHGTPAEQRRHYGELRTEYPLPHRNEYPDEGQRTAIEQIEKRIPNLRRTTV